MAFEKIKVANPIVEMDGDEMTRVIWKFIKDKLIFPFLELDIKYFDLGLPHRDATDDKVTIESAEATLKYVILSKDEARVKEFNLKSMWKSPNGTIRNILNGTVFREPILCKNVPRLVPGWTKPICIGRHAFGDQYRATDAVIKGAGKLKLVFVPEGKNEPTEMEVTILLVLVVLLCQCTTPMRFALPNSVGVLLENPYLVINLYFIMQHSVTVHRAFADASMNTAFQKKWPLYLSTKNTILKKYDGRFKDIFQEVYEASWKSKFEEAGIWYEHRLIDDMVAYALKSEGGYVWACKNYDGDVQSDFLAQGFGSLGLMTSVWCALMVRQLRLKQPMELLRATTGFIRKEGKPVQTVLPQSLLGLVVLPRAKLDGNAKLLEFTEKLEAACIGVVEAGKMTKDLALIIHGSKLTRDQYLNTEEFIDAVAADLKARLSS
ncbi:UNVERIFIED_CONTAM: Isocitrate dehydrogenase [NADP] [Sesamum radiatum]|uniref:Isocitrate dehydrogenase [NADP] n=1 Tax=Sesamum radiatum TaxID=300843 RepID=A0AAW2V301_SESRA